MLYKLNVKLKKPIILTLCSLPVIKHINEHSQCQQSILKMETVTQLNIVVPGYGIFNQKYQLQDLCNFFKVLCSYNFQSFSSVKKLSLEFPGWRSFTVSTIASMMEFVKRCIYLEKLRFNLNHCMSLLPITQDKKYEDTFYNKRTFKTEQLQHFLQQICQIQSQLLNTLDLQMGAWEGIDTAIFQIIIHYLEIINQRLKALSDLTLNLNGWGQDNYSQLQQYSGPTSKIKKQAIDKFFQVFQQFTALDTLTLDLRNWSMDLKLNRYKQRLKQLTGGIKKQQNTSGLYMYSMTGTYFGSQIKNKFKNIKVQIIQ